MGPNTESMLRAALVNAEDVNIAQVRAALRELGEFKAHITEARPTMSPQEQMMAEFALEQMGELETRFREILAEAEGTRTLVATGPVGFA